jgi:putative tributyrin esterase
MALCEFRWFSNVLEKQVATLVILPDVGVPPFAAYYLLHGLSDDYTTWQRKTRIEVYAGRWPMIVVMPDGFRGFYTNHQGGRAYAKYIGEELPAMIERNFPAKPHRSARCIGGQSMGAYGALRIALGYPDRFLSANAHSGGLMAGSREAPPNRFPEAEQIFGRHPRGGEHDLIRLASAARAAGNLPRIRIDCGADDHLLTDNREYHRALEEREIAHEYEEFPGGHNWDYWDAHVPQAMAFHAAALNLEPNPSI